MVKAATFGITSQAMQAQTNALAAVSENISNASTIGFRRNIVTFQSMLGQTIGTTDLSQDTSVKSRIRRVMDESGALAPTNSPLSLAIVGEGFFALREDPEAGTNASDFMFTRDGDFTTTNVNGARYVTRFGGGFLQGWPVDENGNYTAGSDFSSLSPVFFNPAEEFSAGEATTDLRIVDIIPADKPQGFQFNMTKSVFDNEGNVHELLLHWQRQADPLSWRVNVTSSDTNPTNLATQDITFNESGNVVTGGTLSFTPSWTNGVASDAVVVDLTGIKHSGSNHVPQGVSSNGQATGRIAEVVFDSTGMLTANFTNGVKRPIFKVPIISFANQSSLAADSNTIFTPTNTTSQANFLDIGIDSDVNFKVGYIEEANVTLDKEFAFLMLAQQAYASAARNFQVLDDMARAAQDMLR